MARGNHRNRISNKLSFEDAAIIGEYPDDRPLTVRESDPTADVQMVCARRAHPTISSWWPKRDVFARDDPEIRPQCQTRGTDTAQLGRAAEAQRWHQEEEDGASAHS